MLNKFGEWLWETRMGASIRGFIFCGLPIFILIHILNLPDKLNAVAVGLAFAVICGGGVYIIRGEDAS